MFSKRSDTFSLHTVSDDLDTLAGTQVCLGRATAAQCKLLIVRHPVVKKLPFINVA